MQSTAKTNNQLVSDKTISKCISCYELVQRIIFQIHLYTLCVSGFLTAVLQNHARKLSVSVDSLRFTFQVIAARDETEENLNDIKQKLNVTEMGFKVFF